MGVFGMFGKIKTAITGHTTLEDLYKIKTEHGPLTSASYYKGGGMNGDTYCVELSQKNDEAVVTVKISAAHWIPVRVYEYRAAGDAFTRTREYIDQYNLSAWKDLPFDQEHAALDAPSSSIEMRFDDRELTGRTSYVSVSYESMIPDGGMEILNGFTDLLYGFYTADDLIETYLLDENGEKVLTGRDVENTDVQRDALLRGYWRSESFIAVENGETTKERPANDHDFMIYELNSTEYGMRLITENADGRIESDYQFLKYVSSPLMDLDASWYAVFRETDGEKELYLTAVGDRIYLIFGAAGQGASDYQIAVMKRYDL